MTTPALALRPGAAVDVVVPASAANLGPGFDSMGLALGVYDSYRAVVRAEPGLELDLGPDSQGVPTDETHLVVATMYRAWDELGVERPAGLTLVCRNTIRMGRGMGSSAAAIVAGIALAHGLTRPEAAEGTPDGTPVPIDLDAVNDLAGLLEGHPDNASASVYGGATLSYLLPNEAPQSVPPVRTIRLPLHSDIEPIVFVPAIQLSTATARAVLPAQVPHPHAALNSARAGVLVHALTLDPALLLPGTVDWLHQEQRRESYSDAMALVDALRAQEHAAVISGAGPSVLVLTTTPVADDVQAPAQLAEQWTRLRPGVPDVGVCVRRATLGTSLGERAVRS